MKRKSGLHKKVSSIFGGTSLPNGLSVGLADDDAASAAESAATATDLPESILAGPAAGPTHKTIARVTPSLTKDQLYEAPQKRKLFMAIGFGVVFVVVIFFNFRQPGKKTAVNQDELSAKVMPVKVSKIYWPKPEIWPADIMDPMVFKKDTTNLSALESKVKLRGIVNKPEGRSMALLGTDIFFKGDEIDGWTIMEISLNSVKLKKPDGEEMELKMEDR